MAEQHARHPVFRVFIDLQASGAYQRPILRGVLRYAAEAPRWDAHFSAFGGRMIRSASPERYPERYDGRIVTNIRAHPAGEAAIGDEPIVVVSDRYDPRAYPMVIPDNVAVGEMAADYLIELGFRRFAMVGPLKLGVGRRRHEGFRRRVEPVGGVVAVPPDAAEADRGIYEAPAAWLKQLPAPCGVFCWNDETARNVIVEAREVGLAVPEDLAVVGVHDDDLICVSVRPSITSIALPLEQIGYEAATLLDRLMRGEPPPDRPVQFAPIEVVQRDSTRPTAEDRDVARAIQIIRRRACEGLTVEEVCDDLDLAVSRRTLERRFVEALGRSPHEEIRRVQCQHARHLLVNTNLPQEEVALRCGFSSNPFFSNTFKRVTGQRPGEYRKQRRRR